MMYAAGKAIPAPKITRKKKNNQRGPRFGSNRKSVKTKPPPPIMVKNSAVENIFPNGGRWLFFFIFTDYIVSAKSVTIPYM